MGVSVGVTAGSSVGVGVSVSRIGAVGVEEGSTVGICVCEGVTVASTGQVVWLNKKPNISSGELPTLPATGIVTFESKFVTTILNTSEAPFLKLLNFGWNTILVKPGLPAASVQITL